MEHLTILILVPHILLDVEPKAAKVMGAICNCSPTLTSVVSPPPFFFPPLLRYVSSRLGSVSLPVVLHVSEPRLNSVNTHVVGPPDEHTHTRM